jgi:hypothetical protein
MGRKSSHIAKAKHNEEFMNLIQKFDSLTNPYFPDWIVTVIFYMALHHIDSKLATVAPPPFDHPGDHGCRNTAVSLYLRKISKYYFFLKGKSEFGRYIPYSEKNISPSTVRKCIKFLSYIV